MIKTDVLLPTVLLVFCLIFVGCEGVSEKDLTNTFSDEELGLKFDYPAEWGDAESEVFLDSNSVLTKKISFEAQPDIYFETSSPALLSDANDLKGPTEEELDISKYCSGDYSDVPSKPLSYFNNVYAQNGLNEFVQCYEENAGAVIHKTVKESESKAFNGVVMTRDEFKSVDIESTLSFSKRFYLKLENSLYGNLVVYQNGIPDVETKGFCYSSWSEVEQTYNVESRCIGYDEKSLIDDAFFAFSNSDFNKATMLMLSSVEITSVTNPEANFLANFSNSMTFEDEALGYSYEYPEIFALTSSLVTTISKDNVIVAEKNLENCEGMCLPLGLSSVGWEDEKKLLESNHPDGVIDCIEGIYAGRAMSACEIKTLGENRFLIRLTLMNLGDLAVKYSYIIYENELRHEIQIPVEYEPFYAGISAKELADKTLIGKIYEEVAESLTFR